MPTPHRKNSIFSGIILVLLAGIVATAGMLWKSFIEFSENASGLDQVFSAVSDHPAFTLTPGSRRAASLTFGFVVPRGELVKFLSFVQPHLASIAARVDKDAKLEIVPDTSDLIKGIESGHIDIAALTAVQYVKNRKRHNIVGLLERKGASPKFAMFVVRKDSVIGDISALKDRIIAYKNPDSMSAYTIPKMVLARMGIDGPSFFKRELFSNNLQTSVIGLLNREYDCAVMSNTFFNELDLSQQKLLREIYHTEPVPGGVYIVSGDTSAQWRTNLEKAFIAQGQMISAEAKFSGLFRVSPLNSADYDFVPNKGLSHGN